MLGVCLGSQLIARALGSTIRPGPEKEIGWAPIQVHDDSDPILAGLAPASSVLHWHGDIFDLPPGAQRLASSEMTEVQAFRVRNAWGLLFHAEADFELCDLWLAERSMREEAEDVIGPDAAETILAHAQEFNESVTEVSTPGFEAFAALVAARAA